MSSLFGTLSLALGALRADQGAMQVTADNISNVNTEGYARRRAELEEQPPVWSNGVLQGGGVVLNGVRAMRDRVLELRMNEEARQQAEVDAFVNSMQQVEPLFADSESGLSAQIDAFFSSVTKLSTDPRNVPLRQAVLTSAGNLVDAFHNYASSLANVSANIDLSVEDSVTQVNEFTRQIAALNTQIARVQDLGGDANTLEDQRTQLIRQLSGVMDVSQVDSSDGLTLTTSSGSVLVVGSRSFDLTAAPGADGTEHMFFSDTDITDDINGGKIAGIFAARTEIAGLRADLDLLARQLAGALNDAQQAGFDLSGNPGAALFSFSDTTSAASMQVLLDDPAGIAASSDGSPGSNGNLLRMLDVKSSPVINGQNATDFCAGMAFRVGSAIANGQAESEASGLILRQLQNQRGAVSGVSLDEEAADLIRFQRAYEAAARVISVISDLTETAVNLGRN